jgi:hypothetical protein
MWALDQIGPARPSHGGAADSLDVAKAALRAGGEVSAAGGKRADIGEHVTRL